MNRITRLALVSSIVALAFGCSKSPSTDGARSDAKPAAWMLTSAPANAAAVTEAKASAAEGDTVTVRGRIGGRVKPIADDSAVFTIVDLGVEHCGQMGMDDGCTTPWDYCCEPKENLTANSATVQLVNDKGESIDVNPIAAGLSPLDEVIVVGTVGPRPDPNILTIRATAVYRNPG